jgi:hypothetical protein
MQRDKNNFCPTKLGFRSSTELVLQTPLDRSGIDRIGGGLAAASSPSERDERDPNHFCPTK